MKTEEWQERYRSGNIPWDTGRVDEHLMRVVQSHPIAPCRVLEVGCGTGTNAVWLAQQGFEVVATDLASGAVELARQRVRDAGVTVRIIHAPFPPESDDTTEPPFDFIFDRGFFHNLEQDAERAAFAQAMAAHLTAEGLWLSIVGSTDGPPREHGPPRRSARQVVAAVEPELEILSLGSGVLDVHVPTVPRVWIGLYRRRMKVPPERL